MSPPAPPGPPDKEGSAADRRFDALDANADPGALGASGAEASVEVGWWLMLRHRVQARTTASPRYEWWILVALLAGLLSLNITFTVFVVALPTVSHQLHTSPTVLTWSSTGPLLAFGLAAPIFGRASDLFGHRRLYLFGLAGAAVSAVVTATAPDVGVLLFGRALDGVQGAATGTASMALILDLFAPEDRVRAMGWWSLVGAGGPVIGVTLGSPVIQYFGWRDLFWGQLGMLVVSATVVALVLPAHGRRAAPAQTDEGNRWRGMDWIGSWSLSGCVTGAMLVLSIGPIVGWSSPGVVVAGCFSLVALVVFIRRELTAPAPLIPTKYLKRRNFTFSTAMRAFASFGYFGGFFLTPLLMEQVYGFTVTKVGLVSIARPLVFALCSPIAGYAATRVGERASVVFGAVSVTVSMTIFALVGASVSVWLLVLALSLSGLGMGVALPSATASASNEVDESEYGVMTAAQLLGTQVGQVAGIQVLVTIQESIARSQGLVGARQHGPALLSSFHDAFWVGMGVSALGVLSALFLRSMHRRGPAPDFALEGS